MNTGTKLLLSILGAVGLAGLAVFLSAQFLFGSLADLFSVPRSSLTYVTVANWTARQFEEADEVTLLFGEASRETGDAWTYRAITDHALLQKEDVQFGYYAGFFERITSIPGHSSCSINGKPRGRSISVSINGAIVRSRSACRLSALDIADLWKLAMPVAYQSSMLPRQAHREMMSSLRANPSVRVISHDSNYSPYDKTVRIVLPTLWAEKAQTWEERIDVRLEEAIAAVLPEKVDVLEVRFSERSQQEGEGPLRPQVEQDDGSCEQSCGYIVAGDAGVRIIRNLDFYAPEVRIRCATTMCEAIAKIDFSSLVVPFRNGDVLQDAYAEASLPSTNDKQTRPLDIDRIRNEDVVIGQSDDILYGAYWIDIP